ncbi:hypothetical protein IVG45_13930 [Methylomonas sp. LL1]|uniref:hypothetical protein n=1 Tax=Methylomonas sp. LL1 TaxID=2785785 RepID=UPI0018C38F75|nr:hypothetical protein [Methylomonas sp. LL1]QPK61957.1 hypothetical protein IVG45_13930 [Methylomonas sp. LL1]CAG1021580.1 hypothetical protein MTYM_01100 [Methylococcales bacterium]
MTKNFHANISGAIIGVFALFCASFNLLASPPDNKGKPVDGSFVVDLPANSFINCPFDIHIEVIGNTKTTTLPGNRFITNNPNMQAVITNSSNPTKTVSLSITGATHQSTNNNGDKVTVATGRNLMGDPVAGLVLSIGTFSFVFDASGNNLVQPLMGQGQLIDVCQLIS